MKAIDDFETLLQRLWEAYQYATNTVEHVKAQLERNRVALIVKRADGRECCGRCYEDEACECEACACGHCRHDHEKWRWHHACRYCTPLFYAGEVPNEIDTRPLAMGDEERRTLPRPDLEGELARHRPRAARDERRKVTER
jgi:hypothetical protein